MKKFNSREFENFKDVYPDKPRSRTLAREVALKARIAALEGVVGYLLPKAEYSNDGNCPVCDVYHKEHLDGCPFIKARAVLEDSIDEAKKVLEAMKEVGEL